MPGDRLIQMFGRIWKRQTCAGQIFAGLTFMELI
jgi:hypothetical protein